MKMKLCIFQKAAQATCIFLVILNFKSSHAKMFGFIVSRSWDCTSSTCNLPGLHRSRHAIHMYERRRDWRRNDDWNQRHRRPPGERRDFDRRRPEGKAKASYSQRKFSKYRYDGGEMIYFATCCRGLEEVLAEELKSSNIRAMDVQIGFAGVTFKGDHSTGYRAALWLRSAHKVLHLIGSCEGGICSRDDLYNFVAGLDWDNFITPEQTLAVDSVLSRPAEDLTHTHYTALNVKNAIVDQMRERHGLRPSVDFKNADLPLLIFLQGEKAKLYRCLSGVGSMHKRGYREAMHVASLKENIAAGLLLASEWDPTSQVLVDPMCGSATLPIEAALIAMKLAPGLIKMSGTTPEELTKCREHVFTRWQDFEPQVWTTVLKEATSQALDQPPARILANDMHVGAITLAKRDAILADVIDHIEFSNLDAAEYRPPVSPDFVITNPPWDMRLEEASESWDILGQWLVTNAQGADAWIYTGNERLAGQLPCSLKPVERWVMNQAGVDTSLIHYTVPASQKPREKVFDLQTNKVGTPREDISDAHVEAPLALEGVEASATATAKALPQQELHMISEDKIDKMLVAELKDELRKRNLRVGGVKAELQSRLKEFMSLN